MKAAQAAAHYGDYGAAHHAQEISYQAHAALQDLAAAQHAANKAYSAAQSAQASVVGQGAYNGFGSGYGGAGCPSCH